MNFINDNKKNYIYKKIRTILPNLNDYEFSEMINIFVKILNHISHKFTFDPTKFHLYWEQIISNNDQNLTPKQ